MAAFLGSVCLDFLENNESRQDNHDKRVFEESSEEHWGSAIRKHVREQHGGMGGGGACDIDLRLKILQKCQGKFDYLAYKMLLKKDKAKAKLRVLNFGWPLNTGRLSK